MNDRNDMDCREVYGLDEYDQRFLQRFATVPVERWVAGWIARRPSPEYRGDLASQLNLIRKRHGSGAAVQYRNYVLWLGSYPVKGMLR